jgi:anti-anti-sigma factor
MYSNSRMVRKHRTAEAMVIELVGRTYGSLADDLQSRVSSILLDLADQSAPRYLLVDLTNVEFFGARFAGILVCTWNRLRRNERRLVVCGLKPLGAKLVRTLHLDNLFDIYETQQAALARIDQGRTALDGLARSMPLQIRTSDVAWDPSKIRLEYLGEDNAPFFCEIVPRAVASAAG